MLRVTKAKTVGLYKDGYIKIDTYNRPKYTRGQKLL